jgi:ElaB/YqjD/DUF883 family membrane-anchored ribosome-binding protein
MMESKTTIESAADAAVKLAHLTHEVSKAKTLVNDFVEDGTRKAQRLVKRGVVTAEDYVEDTTYYIKRHPWQSVGVAAGVGAGAGLLLGWIFSRACAEKCSFQAVER